MTTPELFSALCKTLLSKGKYLGDAHYLFGRVDVLPKIAGGTKNVPGKFRLEDYSASDTRHWVFGEYGGADPKQQAQLLESGNTVLNIQLYPEGSNRPFGTWYNCFRPSDIRQGDDFSVTGATIESLGADRSSKEILVVQESLDTPPTIQRPSDDPQLQLLYRAIAALAQ